METSLAAYLEECKDFEDLEKDVFELVCRIGREFIQKALQALDLALRQGREPGLRLVGDRKRTLTTRLGDVTFERRLYLEKDTGHYRFLLDEALKLPVKEGLSKGVANIALSVASELPYRRAAAVLRSGLPQALSATALQRLVWRFGGRVEQAEAAKQEATFRDGEVPEMGKESISRLFIEGDGVSVALQREEQRRGEVKVGIGYTGWDRVSVDHYRVRGKVVHAGVEEPEVFWERYWLGTMKRYDVSQLEYVVVNGDGANWVPEGSMGIPGVFQLDRFHLHRALKEAFCEEEAWANRIYWEATEGSWERVQELITRFLSRGDLTAQRRQTVEEVYRYMANNREGLRDWRLRLPCLPGDRGMGAMEGNVDKIIAIRTKRRGMSWRTRGVHCMAKLLQCVYEGEVATYASPARQRPSPARMAQPTNLSRRKARGHDTPFSAELPALVGPHAGRPLAKLLRAVSSPYPIS